MFGKKVVQASDANLDTAGTKYTVDVTRSGPNAFCLQLGGKAVDIVARKLNDGGLLIQVRFQLFH